MAIPALSLKMTRRLEASIAYVHLWQRSSKATWMRLATLRHCTRSSRSSRQNSKQKPRHCPTFTTPHHTVHSSGLEFIFPMPSGLVYKYCVHMIELYVLISGCGIGLSRKLSGAWNWPSPISIDYIYIYIYCGGVWKWPSPASMDYTYIYIYIDILRRGLEFAIPNFNGLYDVYIYIYI